MELILALSDIGVEPHFLTNCQRLLAILIDPGTPEVRMSAECRTRGKIDLTIL